MLEVDRIMLTVQKLPNHCASYLKVNVGNNPIVKGTIGTSVAQISKSMLINGH